MDVKNTILIIAFLVNLFLGFLLFIWGRKKKASIAYGFTVWAVALWTISMIFYRLAGAESNIFLCKILYISALIIPYAFLYFSFLFPFDKFTISKLQRNLIAIPFILMIFLVAYQDLIIKNVVAHSGQEKKIIFGHFYFLYFLYISGYFTWPLWNLFSKYRKSVGLLRTQLKYILSGTFISIVFGTLFNLIMPSFGYFRFNWLGQVSTLIMVFSISYAIIKHRLMDIRVVIKRSTVFSAIVVVITAAYTLAAFLLGWLVFGGVYTLKTQIITGLIVALIIAIGFRPFYDWLRRITDTFLFKGEYRPQELMANISDALSQTLDLDTVISILKKKIRDALRVEKIRVVILKRNNAPRREYQSKEKEKTLEKIITYFKKEENKETIILEEIKRKRMDEFKFEKIFSLIEEIEKLGIALIVPLFLKEKLVGLFLLSSKKSGDMFTNEDIKTLESIASQVAIAAENASLYGKMKSFSKTLQREVDRQTKTLREANIRLQQLDRAKSEFLFLASHQLRTPLTAIKGYISMILEGFWGKVNEKQKHILKNVYLSNERLINLVEDLLNVSRIESGQLKFNFKLLSLDSLIEDVVKDFSQIAETKGIYLKCIKPKKPFPKIKADSLKIRQVIQVLIENSIHYTKKGGVIIQLKAEKDKVMFSVKDTGIGIPPEEQVTLFEKFARGKGINRMYTEGVGLGLYLANKFIKAHRGRIWVESKGKNKGSTFFVELPRTKNT